MSKHGVRFETSFVVVVKFIRRDTYQRDLIDG